MQPFETGRLFDAPREKVWQAWTEPARLKQWWGPRGFTVHTCKVDLRPGGTFLYGMKGPDGSDVWGKFVYREIKAPEKLVFVVSFSDPKGGVTRHPMSPDWPRYILSTVQFIAEGGEENESLDLVDPARRDRSGAQDLRRRPAVDDTGLGRHAGSARGVSRKMSQKMNQHTVELTRVFEAPRERVFECWTRAEHLQHWFGPKGFLIHSCETDPRPGGVFKLCLRAPDGKDYWVRGQFQQMDFPNHLVITCAADDDKGVERLQEVIDVTFREAGGRTTVSLNAKARGPSDEAAAMLKGMDQGWAQTVDRLGAHLRK